MMLARRRCIRELYQDTVKNNSDWAFLSEQSWYMVVFCVVLLKHVEDNSTLRILVVKTAFLNWFLPDKLAHLR